MVRVTLLCLALGTLAQFAPDGCTLNPPVDGGLPLDRGTIDTQASAPESAGAGDIVTLEATASGDVSAGPISFNWIQVAGYGVVIEDASQASAKFTAPSLPADQELRFLVATTNERGDIGRAEVAVRILADPNYVPPGAKPGAGGPTARAGADRTVAGGSTVTLDASGSRGTGLTYHWRQLSGATVTLTGADTVRAVFVAPTYDASGSITNNRLEFELQARDSHGRTATDRVVVTIRAGTGGDESNPKPRVRIKTTLGDFVVELNREKAPKTVENFLRYVDEKFYDNTMIHRVIKDFVIQGGGYEPGLKEKKGHDAIQSEADNGLTNRRGSIGMARLADPDSATSQFYVNLVDNSSLDEAPGRPGYTVFGQVVEGLDVVDKIGAVQTETREQFQNVPVTDVIVNKIERITQSSGNPNEGTITPRGSDTGETIKGKALP